MSTPPTILRRASYGPQSLAVGERGARTRRHIVEVALALFGDVGVHAVSVEDIARGAGISRATLYQYFESKEEIFLELLHESGTAQQAVLREMSPLGPTAAGFRNLCRWLAAWDNVYDKYATTFVQCAGADSPNAPLRPTIDRWVDTYQADIAERLVEMPIDGLSAMDLAGASWSMLERFSYYRQLPPMHLDHQTAVNNRAVIMQLLLFPNTPSELLTIGGRFRNHTGRPVAPSDPVNWHPDVDRFAGLRSQSRRTLRQLLEAGQRVFAANGYHDCSVDQVVADAQLTRRTFYKYFDNKQDLLATLVRECAETMVSDSGQFADIGPAGDGADQLRVWLGHYLMLHRRHSGLFRVWIDHIPDQPALAAAGLAGSTAALRSLARVLGRFPRSYPLDPMAAALMLYGLIERFPDRVGTRDGKRDDERTVDVMMQIIERGFLNPGT